MNLRKLIALAQNGDNSARAQIVEMYRPLLMKESIINERLDEDLFQEQCITLLRCIEMFKL